jgi:hypothetical protein
MSHYNSLVETMDQGQGAEEDQEQDAGQAAEEHAVFLDQDIKLSHTLPAFLHLFIWPKKCYYVYCPRLC